MIPEAQNSKKDLVSSLNIYNLIRKINSKKVTIIQRTDAVTDACEAWSKCHVNASD